MAKQPYILIYLGMIMQRLVINMAMTMDGKSVLPTKRWQGLTSKRDRDKMDSIRAACDAVIVGAASLEADNAKLYVRNNPQAKHPLPVILSGSGCLKPELQVFAEPHPAAVVVSNAVAKCNLREHPWLPSRQPSFYIWQGWHEISRLLDWLFRERACMNILLEGGPTVNANFFRYAKVDEMYLTIVPYVIGGSGHGPVSGQVLEKIRRAEIISALNLGDELFLHYRFSY